MNLWHFLKAVPKLDQLSEANVKKLAKRFNVTPSCFALLIKIYRDAG